MKKYIILLIALISPMMMAFAEDFGETKRYEVANKSGKARFVEVEPADGHWKYVKRDFDMYLDNGTIIEAFEIPKRDDLNYAGTKFVHRKELVFNYEGKYYIVVFPDKDLKPVNEKGETTAGLGIRNYLSNTWLGDWYRTSKPGLIALACAFFSLIFLIWRLFKGDEAPMFMRWCYAVPLCIISLLEIGAAFSLGTDAAWWVNPDDVGYWIATPLLIPYCIVAAMMVFSVKNYRFVGEVEGLADMVITVLLYIGIVLTVISAIFVVINFLFAACLLLFAGWMFKGTDSKDFSGNTINSGPLGTYETDKYGRTRHKGN